MKEIINKVIILGCTGLKDKYATNAQDLYSKSPVFYKSLRYSKKLGYPIHIISAKHHLLNLKDPISYYQYSIMDMTSKERIEWGNIVKNQLAEKYDLDNTTFIMLAGMRYCDLIDLPHKEEPLRGKGSGQRMQYLDEKYYDLIRKNNGKNE